MDKRVKKKKKRHLLLIQIITEKSTKKLHSHRKYNNLRAMEMLLVSHLKELKVTTKEP